MKDLIKKRIPQHIAIIMDGNGRWAQQRNLPRTLGHAKGVSGLRLLVQNCTKIGINYLTLFAFSTENWGRPAGEVSALMALFAEYLEREVGALVAAGVRLKVIGDLKELPVGLQNRICAAEQATQYNQLITLVVAANYGGRWDIVQAVKKWHLSNSGADASTLTQEQLSLHLSTKGMPDIDLLIRTGGEQRISNFLLWQLAYSEVYFTEILWPEFDLLELTKALDWYGKRDRRFGAIPSF